MVWDKGSGSVDSSVVGFKADIVWRITLGLFNKIAWYLPSSEQLANICPLAPARLKPDVAHMQHVNDTLPNEGHIDYPYSFGGLWM
jgi:hypothetical protein